MLQYTYMRNRFNTIEKIIMVFLALFFDLLSIIPFLNILINVLAWFIFSLWFTINGLPPNSYYKVTGTAVLAFVIGLVPFVSILPEITTSIVVILTIIHMEDKGLYKKKIEELKQASTTTSDTTQ